MVGWWDKLCPGIIKLKTIKKKRIEQGVYTYVIHTTSAIRSRIWAAC